MNRNLSEQFVVNIGGRNREQYDEAKPIANLVAGAIREASITTPILGKNGGLMGSMQAFLEAWKAEEIYSIPVLTKELDKPEYAPAIARENPRKLLKRDNTERLAEIIKHPGNRLLIVTTGGTGTLEEISAALCENEFRIKWPQEAVGEPFPIFVVGDCAVSRWRPIFQQIFRQLSDTHPLAERLTVFISTEYIKNGFLAEEVVRVLANP